MTVKANRTLGFIRRKIRTKHKGIRETAYNTLVRPVEYASPEWSPYTQTSVTKVEQRRAARWVSDDYSSYSSVTQMLNTLWWRSLEQRRADARQGCLRHCRDTYAITYSPSCQNDQNYAPYALRADPYYSKLLQIFIFSFSNCTVEQTPHPGCHIHGPEFLQVHRMHPSSLHAIDHDTLFFISF